MNKIKDTYNVDLHCFKNLTEKKLNHVFYATPLTRTKRLLNMNERVIVMLESPLCPWDGLPKWSGWTTAACIIPQCITEICENSLHFSQLKHRNININIEQTHILLDRSVIYIVSLCLWNFLKCITSELTGYWPVKLCKALNCY